MRIYTYQRATAMYDASHRIRRNERALGGIEVLLGLLHEPQVRLDVHIEGAIPLVLVAVVVDAVQAPDSGPTAIREQDVEATEPLNRLV
jgi:hypothetical protein